MFVGQMYCQILSELMNLETSAADCPVANCSLFALETLVFSRIFQLSSRYTVTQNASTQSTPEEVFFFFVFIFACIGLLVCLHCLNITCWNSLRKQLKNDFKLFAN